MSIEIKRLTLGMVQTNAYLIGDQESKDAILIDPVAEAERLLQTAQDAGWTIRLILATHAHFDHVLASKALQTLTGAPFWCHQECVEWLEILPQQGRMFGLGDFPEAAQPNHLFGDVPEWIEVGAIKLQSLYTPGHAPGHLSFYMPEQRVVFSGDTLFRGAIGRWDLPGGDFDLLIRSIKEQLLPLGDDTRVLPGHMEETSIGREKQINPYL